MYSVSPSAFIQKKNFWKLFFEEKGKKNLIGDESRIHQKNLTSDGCEKGAAEKKRRRRIKSKKIRVRRGRGITGVIKEYCSKVRERKGRRHLQKESSQN